MITYNRLEDGNLSGDGQGSIPPGHRWHDKALAQVEAGEAEIIPYSAPEPTIKEQAEALEATVTDRWVRMAALGDAYAIERLEEVESAIAALGVRVES